MAADFLFISRNILRPLFRFQKGTEIIGAGNLEFRIESKANDEVGQLTRAFNRMVTSLKTTMASREELGKEIRESEERYRLLFSSGNDAVFVNQPTAEGIPGKFIEVNDIACQRYGYKRDELLNLSPLDLRAPEHVGDFNPRAENVLPERATLRETVHVTKDGRRIPVEIHSNIFKLKGETTLISIVRDITERKQIEEELREKRHNLGERIKELNCLYGISTLVEKPGISLEEILQGTVDLIPPSWQYPEITCARITLEGNEYKTRNFRETKWKQSQEILVHGESAGGIEVHYLKEKPEIDEGPFLKEERNLINVIAERLGHIVEHRRAHEQVKASLKEKEVLLREIHHRVKNNMQVTSGLLKLQSARIKDKQAIEVFKESQGRIKSMALVHDQLYRSKDLANIDFKEYVNELIKNQFASYGIDTSKISSKIEIADISLEVDFATPCGLIINELISNSLKYAFPQEREGEIGVSLRTINGDEFELIVSDEGIGIPKEIDFENTESFGLYLVKMLVRDQLKGTIEIKREEGTEYHIRFKKPTYSI